VLNPPAGYFNETRTNTTKEEQATFAEAKTLVEGRAASDYRLQVADVNATAAALRQQAVAQNVVGDAGASSGTAQDEEGGGDDDDDGLM
jgi:hypothetical protein